MSDTVDRVVLVEFLDEAEAYVSRCRSQGVDPSAILVISLDSKVQAWLIQQGVRCVNTLPYFTTASHARALRKSHQLLGWLEPRIQLEDQLGVKDAYSNDLLWYTRYFTNHLIWLAEVLSQVIEQHPGAVVMAPRGQPAGSGGPMLTEGERYLGSLAREFCLRQGLPFEAIDFPSTPQRKKPSINNKRWLHSLGYRLGAPLHRAALRRLGKRQPLLVLTHGHRMNALVEQARKEAPEYPWVVRGESGRSTRGVTLLLRALRGATAGLSRDNGSLYIGEVWHQVLAGNLKGQPSFNASLSHTLERLAVDVEREEELFTHQGVPFGVHYAHKLRTGILNAISDLHREVCAIDQVLSLLHPRLVMAPFGRKFAHVIGDLAQRRGIPGLLISHGSFTPLKDDLEEKAWPFHAYGMLHGSYTHAALQTPLAEAFAQQVPSSARFLRTGPLVWGMPVNREASTSLKSKLIAGGDKCRVVVHAGTPKPRGSTHFHVYETPDEYVAAVRDLVLAVNELDGVFLVVRYRPSGLSAEDLRLLLPSSDKYCISMSEPFPDVLGLADLLVSFSSTTIEEALQNRVPVLLYGGEGRYQHVEALEVTPEKPVESRAVYSVARAGHLADALRRILDINGPSPLPQELFQDYVYRPDQITPFPEVVRNLVKSGDGIGEALAGNLGFSLGTGAKG